MQGRFKRDGSASAEPEPHGGTGTGSSPQHAQNPGPAQAGDNGERSSRTGAPMGVQGKGGPNAVNGGPGNPPAAPPTAKSPSGPGSRIALRNWRISTRLVSLLALPVVAATSLGAFRISDTMDEIQQLENMKLLTDMTKQATELASALQEERDKSAGPLANGTKASDFTVKGVRDKSDRARAAFMEGTHELDDAGDDENLDGVRDNVVAIATQLNTLSGIRNNAFQDNRNSSQSIEAYHRLIDQLLGLSQDMAEATSNPEMIQRTRALAAFSTAKEYASIQRAVIAAALPATDATYGKLSENDRQYGLSAFENQKAELTSFASIYEGNSRELTKTLDEPSPTIKAADTYAERVLRRQNGLQLRDKRSYLDWVDADSAKYLQMSNIELTLLNEMEQKARELRNEAEQEAIISGALILLVLGVSLVGAFVVARSMIRSLRRLQDTATKVAQDRLPELVKQLSESDPQDVDTSVESVGVHSKDEIGQVAAAFDDVHREAVRLAAEQALLRGNVNAMFTNLSRRSQGLIQRQLSLISELESREADPDQLSSLFKLDHLATRMRRNGENLLVLAGEEPGRRWTRPVPLVDVLRAAASEVEQYERIELAAVPTTEVAGRVVNDLVHLLAELLENATSFSSPQTKVKVTGHALPDGRVLIEIHDTGIGLSPEDLAAINERLASPPTVDVSVSRRMGLFVVGRLSQRHGIRIQLRPSDSGGTTALVMLPVDVAQGGKKVPGNKQGQGAPLSGGPAAAQAAAGVAAARRGGAGGGPALGAGGGNGGRLNAGPQRGQVGAGTAPRAALPRPDAGGHPGGPGGARGPQTPPPPQGRPAPAGAGAAQGFQSTGTGGQQGFNGFGNSSGQQDLFGGGRDTMGGNNRGPVPPPPQQRPTNGDQGRRPQPPKQPQLPPLGGPRAELPGGNPQPRVPSWSDDNAQPPVPRSSMDTPRGHDEVDATSQMPRISDHRGPGSPASTSEFPRIEDRQGHGSTGEYPRPDYDAPRSGAGAPQGTGQFVRPDVFGQPNPSGTGQNPSSGGQYNRQDPASTGQFAMPGYDAGSTGQYAAPGQDVQQNDTGRFPTPNHGERQGGDTGQFERPGTNGSRPQRPQQPPQPRRRPALPQEPEALPPATGPGDGRTPLYDTLETNWFNQAQAANSQNGSGQTNGQAVNGEQAPQQPAQAPTPPQRPVPTASASASWRTTPNDELGRQAERVRQPSAGGVTVSGLPRRVPRANLVAGTAQQQQHQTGPQVSRAPDDVRGRLTNLRRGIQQGRQAGTGQTGSFPSPTHQQER
ncbi:nitrate- and nitrite sensing domain-containing protein [Streptomyces sp. NBC_00878]|uniref:sensor histidine kinase n=1 Tax=Streptomyces sp. NBC_00878 TaxID=2975854 RepID=UPI002259BF77|nr:nitrate- and nitrite sensing domain-containing protein [Streptomyces sp. NBC_00878]MCX4905152.1 nitrate- and nitrite sensing domain-containing protein [Streptomyces sp. NBC_00878]